MNTIGERIRARRLILNMSQAQLASSVGVSAAAVSQWENGNTKGLRPNNLLAAADTLDISMHWLIRGKEKQIKPNYAVKESFDYYLSKDEKNFILSLRKLNKPSQLSLLAFLNSVSN